MIYAYPQVSDINSVSIYKDKQTRTRTQTQRSRLCTESQPREVSILGVQHMSIRNHCKDSKTNRRPDRIPVLLIKVSF